MHRRCVNGPKTYRRPDRDRLERTCVTVKEDKNRETETVVRYGETRWILMKYGSPTEKVDSVSLTGSHDSSAVKGSCDQNNLGGFPYTSTISVLNVVSSRVR